MPINAERLKISEIGVCCQDLEFGQKEVRVTHATAVAQVMGYGDTAHVAKPEHK